MEGGPGKRSEAEAEEEDQRRRRDLLARSVLLRCATSLSSGSPGGEGRGLTLEETKLLFAAAAAARAAAAVAAASKIGPPPPLPPPGPATLRAGGMELREQGRREEGLELDRLKGVNYCGSNTLPPPAAEEDLDSAASQQQQQQQAQRLHFHLSAFSDFRQLKKENSLASPPPTVKKADSQQQQQQQQRPLKPKPGSGKKDRQKSLCSNSQTLLSLLTQATVCSTSPARSAATEAPGSTTESTPATVSESDKGILVRGRHSGQWQQTC